VQRSLQQPSWRWSFFDWFVHGRVVFPELSTIYDELPPDVRQRITREQARDYDTHIRSARRVINSVTAGDADLRRQLTLEIAAVAWDRRGPAIVLDVLTDALENVLATASFHGRVAYAAWFQEGPIEWGSRTDATTWTWSRIARTHPRTARLHWASSAVLLALAAGLAILERRRGPARAASRRSPARWVAWLPTLVFVAINALAFALAADLLHVRYALLAHAATLVFVYASALEAGRPTQREAAARGD
jgi:hypothetical protein